MHDTNLIDEVVDQLMGVMEELARSYRKTNGLDGAYDPELRMAEKLIDAWKESKQSST